MGEVHGVSGPLSAGGSVPSKVERAGREFEGVLLNTLLAGLDRAFTHLPGATQEQTAETYSGLALQQLAAALARGGGIGLGKMVAKALEKAQSPSSGTAL